MKPEDAKFIKKLIVHFEDKLDDEQYNEIYHCRKSIKLLNNEIREIEEMSEYIKEYFSKSEEEIE